MPLIKMEPQIDYLKASLYPQRVSVWCDFWAGGMIGPYFFENEAGAAVSVNGLRYRTIINEFLWPELEDMDGPANVAVEAISMILFFIINGKPSAIK